MRKWIKRGYVLTVIFCLFFASFNLRPAKADSTLNGTVKSMPVGATISFAGYQWTVLDPTNGYLFATSPISSKAFGSDYYSPKFNGSDLEVYLNNTFINSMSSGQRSLVKWHTWTVGEYYGSSEVDSDYVGLLSSSEWSNYSSAGILSKPSSTFWLIDYDTDYDSGIGTVDTSGSTNYHTPDNVFDVRPALYIDPNAQVANGIVDTAPPTLNLSESAWTNTSATLTASATDDTGVSQIELPNGTWVSGSNAVYKVYANGTYQFIAQDISGKQTTKTITVSSISSYNTKVLGGNSYSLALKSNGTVWGWGNAQYGVYGNGATSGTGSTPRQATGITNAMDIAVSATMGNSSYALKRDGTVWSWGLNNYGQLGDGTTTNKSTPVQVSGLTGITQITAGADTGYALKSDGTVWSWGYGSSSGELGNGSTTSSKVPVQVQGLTGVIQITGGNSYVLALKDDGTVWSWGYNSAGQLGNGTTTSSITPVQVQGITGVTQVSASSSSSLALKSDGTAWSWGNNGSGQLGDGTTTGKSSPVQVQSLTGITQIATGYDDSFALKSDGTLWSWGGNYYGQLGNGTTTNSSTPTQTAQGLTGFSQISGGYYYSFVLKSDESVWSTGYNASGQLGITGGNLSTPVYAMSLDGNPPSLTLSQSGSWSSVTITATASDSESGVKQIQTPDGTWVTGSTASYTVTSNGTYQFVAQDNAGNQTTQSVTVTGIDITPPSLSVTGNPTSVVHNSVTLSANASDSGSGVKQIQTPDGVWHAGSSVGYTVSSNGNYTFIAQDNAGNQTTQTVSVTNIGDLLWFSSLPSSSITLSPTTETGSSQVLNGTGTSLSLQDNRGTGQGWHLTIQATQLKDSNGHVLPQGTFTVKAPVITGTDSTPTTSISGYQQIDSSSALTLATASVNNGVGTYNIDLSSSTAIATNIPANAYSGSYSTTLTWDLVSAP